MSRANAWQIPPVSPAHGLLLPHPHRGPARSQDVDSSCRGILCLPLLSLHGAGYLQQWASDTAWQVEFNLMPGPSN